VDESRGEKPYRVLCELLAKLLGQLVQHWVSPLGGSPPEVSGVKAAKRVRRRAARLAEALGALGALVAVLGRPRRRPRRRACWKRGRPGRPTTLEVVRQPELYGYGGAADASPPGRHRCEIPADIAKAVRAA
jgi:hypothetical protein